MNTESTRCLLCKNASCQKACPVHTNIPYFMELYRNGEIEKAGKELFEHNPFSVITSQICDHERFCFGHCVLNAKGEPVAWYEIEQEIASQFLTSYHPQKERESKKKIAIVGAGPAGITATLEFSKYGYQVTIYEKNDQFGGMLRYGIPDFRLEKKYLGDLQRIAEELGVTFLFQKELGKDVFLEDLQKDYDGILLTLGAWVSRELHIEGEELPTVHYALEFLKEKEPLGENVIVVGGGNVAMDVARTIHLLGKEVSIYYRKTFENMPANRQEVEATKKEGIPFEVFATPVKIEKEKIQFARCQNVERNGQIETEILEGTEFKVDYDDVVIAVGETPDLSYLGKEGKLKETGQTNLPKIYVSGDYMLGASTVVQAIQSTKEVVQMMMKEIGK